MRYRARRIVPAVALTLAACVTAAGCAAAAGTRATATGTKAGPAGAPFYGPPGPDPACAAALKAERVLRERQGKDQRSESALDRDFTDFASALSGAAAREKRPATARAMNALASDFTTLVASQSGGAQLPAMKTVQDDGAAFDKACG